MVNLKTPSFIFNPTSRTEVYIILLAAMYLNGKVPVSLSRTTVEMAICVLLHLLVRRASSQRQSPIQHPAQLSCAHKKQNESSTKLNKRQMEWLAVQTNKNKPLLEYNSNIKQK